MIEEKFTYSSNKRSYTLNVGKAEYIMPYVMTLRLKRFVNESYLLPIDELIEMWYGNLNQSEQLLVKKQTLS